QVDAVVGTEGTSQGYILHFGLDTATIIDTIIVYWMSSGEVDTFTNIRPNRRYTIVEGVGIEAVSRPSVKPDKIDLLVYPNPFNDRCVFEVFVPSDNSKLTVYSLDGRIVLSKKLDYGQNTIRFDADGLTSGVYMVYLRADNRIKAKKLFLIK
ncbi:MAG: T9SS type A sorting domain-containing protein, partial [Candidatus Latescibacteria bacterium]|nr:T9SS type A sorting domain-containing protein [Candidatus Latescibacterota bacterium]